jgi:hypothetical protein
MPGYCGLPEVRFACDLRNRRCELARFQQFLSVHSRQHTDTINVAVAREGEDADSSLFVGR